MKLKIKEFNGQTYKCPIHGLITGDEVNEDEIDYGVLEHNCLRSIGKNKKCYERAYYVGHRSTPESKPKRMK